MYQVRYDAHTRSIPIRGLNYHLRQWGEPRNNKPPLVLLHGWMDVGASWQFMVDAFSGSFLDGHMVLAPDRRGFGDTVHHPGVDHYGFADYLADLEFLLDALAPDRSVDLVGHSMGGNVAMLYAGIRPTRIRRLINLEGFGMPATRPAQAAGRYGQWIDELKALHRGELGLKTYPSRQAVADRLVRTNPRLDADRALWLAGHWARPSADGSWAILGDAAHKIVNPHLYRVDEAQAVFQAIQAPTLAVEAEGDSLQQWWKGRYSLADYHDRLKAVPDCRVAVVADAGHMLHHDQPAILAGLIENFLA